MNDIEDRARRLLGGPWGSALPARIDAPGVVRVAMNCSAYRRPFVVVAERRGDTLVMLRNELIAGGHGDGQVMAPAALGSFRFDGGGMWPGLPALRRAGKPPASFQRIVVLLALRRVQLRRFRCARSLQLRLRRDGLRWLHTADLSRSARLWRECTAGEPIFCGSAGVEAGASASAECAARVAVALSGG